jgi:hypothetical protein
MLLLKLNMYCHCAALRKIKMTNEETEKARPCFGRGLALQLQKLVVGAVAVARLLVDVDHCWGSSLHFSDNVQEPIKRS